MPRASVRPALRDTFSLGRVKTLSCGPLAAWTSAWLAGQAAFDDVLTNVGALELVDHSADLAFSADRRPSLSAVLIAWRLARTRVRVVLPVPGDVRGLPGPSSFRQAALEAGQAVFGAGIGVVPEIVSRGPSSAPPTRVWHAFDVDEPPPDQLSLADAQHDLTEMIRESATALAAAQLAGWFADVGTGLADARRAGERLNLPASFPPRAVQLIAQAERLAAVLDLITAAAADAEAGSIDQLGPVERVEALRPLATAVRRARLVGYNAFDATDGPSRGPCSTPA